MSVRSSLLAVLTMGPAYGLQLHGEIEHRMNRVGSINVGQIYSTLDRLQAHGLVEQSGTTDDGLPLYAATADGLAAAAEWLREAPAGAPVWPDMVSHVLLVTTIPGVDPVPLIDSYRARFEPLIASARAATDDLGVAGDALQAQAAVTWLDLVAERLATTDLNRPRREFRPRRGRKPRLGAPAVTLPR